MPRDSSGIYTLPAGNPVVTDTIISSAWANTTLSDIAAALTNSLPRDGSAAMFGALKMGNFGISGLAAGVNPTDAVNFGQLSSPPAGSIGYSQLSSDLKTALVPMRNRFINGNFDIWQRGTTSGIGAAQNFLADHWYSYVQGSTITQAQQTFPLGQTDVPGNPKYFNRIVVNSVAGANNQGTYSQIIEGVEKLSGGPAVLTFYMKADTPKNIAVEFAQIFDAGSADVLGIGVTTCALTTLWKKFTIPVTIPSISGKMIGGNKNGLYTIFWFDAGSNFNFRTNNLGQQSGTFDIAQCQIEQGNVATPFEVRPYQLELMLCQRYYQRWNALASTIAAAASVNFPVLFRATPGSINVLSFNAGTGATYALQANFGYWQNTAHSQVATAFLEASSEL